MSGPSVDQLTFSDLGEDLSAVTFVVVDLETTGGRASETGITEIGAVKVRGGEILGEFATLVRPAGSIPAHITALTGISNSMVVDAPSVAGAVASFGEFAQDAVLVAHNAPYDLGFLRAACSEFSLSWRPGRSLDTARLARVALQRGEVRNCKLATLATYFHSPVNPEHRALADARATTHVLHCLLERVGALGVHTWGDLRDFVGRVSAAQRAKRSLADHLPTGPGVYVFVDHQGKALYIGTSRNVKARVRAYFTSSETRARMAEMVSIAKRVDAIPCATQLEARIRELRLISERQPHYNRRSRRAHDSWWIRLSSEPAPRFQVTKHDDHGIPDDSWGPFGTRSVARNVADTVSAAIGLRTCTLRIAKNPTAESARCILGHVGNCAAPCSSRGDSSAYQSAVQVARIVIAGQLQPVLAGATRRMDHLADQARYEEAAQTRDAMNSVCEASHRSQRIRALVAAGRVIAAEKTEAGGWDIHVIANGQLTGASYASPSDVRDAVASATLKIADQNPVEIPTTEEMLLLAAWLERPTVTLLHADRALSWPVGSGSLAFRPTTSLQLLNTSRRDGGAQASRPVGPAPGIHTRSRIAAEAHQAN